MVSIIQISIYWWEEDENNHDNNDMIFINNNQDDRKYSMESIDYIATNDIMPLNSQRWTVNGMK